MDRSALKEYATLVADRWRVMLIGLATVVVGLALDLGQTTGIMLVHVPVQVSRTLWIVAMVVTGLIAPFWAFQKVRRERDEARKQQGKAYDATSRLRDAKRLLNEHAAAALDLSKVDSLTTEAVVTLLREAADKVTELFGRYDGEIFREMTSNFLNPAVGVAGDRNIQALRSAAGWLNSRSNSLTSAEIMDFKPLSSA